MRCYRAHVPPRPSSETHPLQIWGRLRRLLEEHPELNGWIPQNYPDRNVVRDVAAFRLRYTNGTLPEDILEAALASGYKFTSPNRQSSRTDRGQERRPRLSIDERFLLVQNAIEEHGSVNVPLHMMLNGEDVFANEKRYCRRDGTMWDWPVGRILDNLKIAARRQGTGILSEGEITLFETLTDREGNHLKLRPETE